LNKRTNKKYILLFFFFSFFLYVLVSQTKTKPKKTRKGQGILGDGVMIGNGIQHNNMVVIG
jgi:hypothetical protein